MELLESMKSKSLLERNFKIRYATLDDKPCIARIWRQHTKVLGGVQFAALNRNIQSKTVYVAIADNKVVGFVDFYARKDNWNTIYHIAVDQDYQGCGVGSQLLFSVPCPIRLKVTADNASAIRFYEHHHMVRVGDGHATTGTPLFTYELRTLFIQCAGNNRKYPDLCRNAGIGYGSRHDDQIRGYPTMIDINWKSYDWNEYKSVIRQHMPIMAMVADYESKSQYHQMIKQVHQLKHLGVLRVMVCPKFDGAIDDIPDDCIIALSVPSTYAGYLPPLERLVGKKVHLLGGSPHAQRALSLKLNGVGAVIVSMDGNSHTRTMGQMWQHGKWQGTKNHVPLYDMFEESAKNIAKMMQHVLKHKQLSLFAA